MPSPFPGMDPFLEHPAYFPDLHDSMNIYLREVLQSKLPDVYFAVVNERLWVETVERYIEPDVDVIRAGGPGKRLKGDGIGHATQATPVVVTVPHDERREIFVEIRTKAPGGDERIVTTIEVLSLGNKSPGEKGRELYLKKQREVLEGDIHLVEIDLLRGGVHTTAAPRWRIEKKTGAFDYHVSIHHFDQVEDFHIYPNQLQEPLPEIAIPLLPGDGAVSVDLQGVLNRCYDAGPYRRRVKYDVSRIVPPLATKQLRWVKARLRAAKVI